MKYQCPIVTVERVEKTPNKAVDRAIIGINGYLVPAGHFEADDKAVLIPAGATLPFSTALSASNPKIDQKTLDGNFIRSITAITQRDMLLKLIRRNDAFWVPCFETKDGVIGEEVHEGQDVAELICVAE